MEHLQLTLDAVAALAGDFHASMGDGFTALWLVAVGLILSGLLRLADES